MSELSRALAQIDAIRGQVARGTTFRGYGPATIALTGLLAIAAAVVQAAWLRSPAHDIDAYLAIWTLTATLAVIMIGIETMSRTRRVHRDLAKQMMHSAVEPFLPAILSGLLLTVVLLRSAPQSLWMLPGLWQIVFSLGVFSACKFLPRPTVTVGVWYLVAGLICLSAGAEHPFSPWVMGIPFGVGQLLVAAVLHFDQQGNDDKA